MNKYSFKFKFLSDLMEIANEFPANPSSRGIVASLSSDDKVDIVIKRNTEMTNVKDNDCLFDVVILYNGDEIAVYNDNGTTKRYMKMLSKMMVVSMMAAQLDKEQSFRITDKKDRTIFVNPIFIYGRKHISIGNGSGVIVLKDITDENNAVDVILEEWLKNTADDVVIDYKSMLVVVPPENMSLAESSFSRNYVVIGK